MKYYKTIQINGKQKRLHRHLMELKLGRKLNTNELVHHKDENIFNNDNDNLELECRSTHKKLHPDIGKKFQFKTKYYIEINDIVKMYETMSIENIAKKYNVAIGTIYYKMKKNNVKTNKRGHKFKK